MDGVESYEGATAKVLPSRFEPLEPLGRGAEGEVWRCRDNELGVEVAVKLLLDPSPERIRGLKRELRILRHLRHPNLVQLYELTAAERGVALSMQVVDGVPLSQRPHADPTGVLGQLMLGLDAVHRSGFVHGDVKPSNVMLTRTGQVVMLDFGLAVAQDHDSERGTYGTLHYAAPEVLWRGRRSAAADVFSAAATWAEWAVGHKPTLSWGSGGTKRWRGHARPGASEAALDLVDRMLAADPSERPTVPAILDALGLTPRSSQASNEHPVGRDQSIASILTCVDADAPGTRLLEVVGAAGIGKTHLVRWLVAHWLGQGVRVLASRCDPIESIPFQALDGIVDGLSDVPGVGEIFAGLAPGERAALSTAFPAGFPSEPSDPKSRPGPAALASALGSVLGRLRATAPIVLWIDDGQWADADSMRVLTEIARRDDLALVLLVTRRGTSGLLFAELRAVAHSIRFDLEPLAAADARALLRRQLPGMLVEDEDDWIRAAQGNPFVLIEATAGRRVASLRDENAMSSADERRRLLLLRAAVCESPVPISVLLACGDASAPDVFGLCNDGILDAGRRRGTPEVEFSHALLRARITEDARPEEIANASLRVAAAWADSEAADAVVVSKLYARGGDTPSAGRWAMRGADEAEARLAYAQAAEMLELVARVDPRDAERVGERLGHCRALAGRPGDAADAFLAASRHESGAGRQRLVALAANTRLASGDLTTGLQLVDQALDAVGLSRPVQRGPALLRFATERARLRLSELLPRGRGRASERLELTYDTVSAMATVYGILDTVTGSTFQALMLRLARQLGDGSRLLQATASELVYTGVTQGPTPRRSALEAEVARLEQTVDDPVARAYAILSRGYEAFMSGRFVEARLRFEQANLAYGDLGGVRWTRGLAASHEVLAVAFLGDIERVASELPERLVEFRSQGDRLNAALLELGAGYLLELARDRPREAEERLYSALEPFAGSRVPALEYLYFRAMTNVDLYAARRDRFAAHWARLRGSRWALGAKANRLEIAWFRALTSDGRSALARAARQIRVENAPWALGLACLLEFHAASREGRSDAASRFASEAAECFDACNMALHRDGSAYACTGDAGARTALQERGICEPDRWCRMLAPACLDAAQEGFRK